MRVLLTAPPTGQGLESIQKIAELILNCREKNRDALLNRYFYPPLVFLQHTGCVVLWYDSHICAHGSLQKREKGCVEETIMEDPERCRRQVSD